MMEPLEITAEVVPPKPVQNEIHLRLPEKAAGELMYVLMNELIWDGIAFGFTTIADVYQALENAGVREARP